jgi:hypothetical protein
MSDEETNSEIARIVTEADEMFHELVKIIVTEADELFHELVKTNVEVFLKSLRTINAAHKEK